MMHSSSERPLTASAVRPSVATRESDSRPHVAQFDTQRFSHSSGQPPQRVPITQSMFYAYAAMKGNFDKEHHQSTDHLHGNLYLHPTSYVLPQFELPINLVRWQLQHDPFMFQDAPRGAIWFQDVSYPPYHSTSSPPESARRSDTNLKNLTYEEHLQRYLPRYMPNHYTGDEGYANHGFVKINGHWIDPESKKEIMDAEGALLDHSRVPRLSIGIEPLPKLTEDELYAAFVEEVAYGPDGDMEGDPRSMYITPAVFSRWAVGASAGERYVSTEVRSPKISSKQLRPCKRLPNPNRAVKAQPQFDEDNGSVFSGEYTLESSPSLCLSARGVNMAAQPMYYSYMDPEMHIQLDRAAYGDHNTAPRVESWLSSSTATSHVIPYNEEDIVNVLAGSEGPEAGVKKWNEYVSRIDKLERELSDNLIYMAPNLDKQASLLNSHAQLYHEAYFLEKRLQKVEKETCSTPATPRSSIAKIANRTKPTGVPYLPIPRKDLLQTPSRNRSRLPHKDGTSAQILGSCDSPARHLLPETPSVEPIEANGFEDWTPAHRKLQRQQHRFEDYFMNQEERHIIKINKTEAMNQNLEVNLKDLAEAVLELHTAHKELRDGLGIQEISEIPDLIPVRERRPRAFDPLSGPEGCRED